MKRFVPLFIVLFCVAVMIGWFVGIYNKIIKADEGVSSAWAQVENVYQRRADLIPQLVNTVKGAADYERGTLEEVVKARATATSVNIDAENLTEANMAAYQAAQDKLSASLDRLLMVMENYPELKANQNFLELQSQLEGTENRISVERKNFNTIVQNYNTMIRRFPNNLVAGMAHFEKKGYFKAVQGAEKAPEVEFNF